MTTLPKVPANTSRLSIHYCGLKNLTEVPSLESLQSLSLRWNDIETVDWMSLRNLPALEFLHLTNNKLTSVSMNVVMPYLPKMTYLNLASNKLATFTSEELGFPALSSASVEHNPIACDCAMAWLIIKVKCMQDKEKGGTDRCPYCPYCIMIASDIGTSYVCDSPRRLKGMLLKTVPENETECAAPALMNSTLLSILPTGHGDPEKEAVTTSSVVEKPIRQGIELFTWLDFPNTTASTNPTEGTTTGPTNGATRPPLTSTESTSKPAETDTIDATATKPWLESHYITVITSCISVVAMILLSAMVKWLVCPNQCYSDGDDDTAANNDIPLQQVN
ncbi:hypothetical protein Bbelb_016180 [Branchiostoma belcheri]|nr:hypothetical protein Bbelb_016180 [Branchiostoma belcheri]